MIGKGKGKSGSGLPATIPPGVSAGAGAREYVALGALTGGEEIQFPKRSGNPLERGDKELSSDGTKGTAQFFDIAIELPFWHPLKCVM
jgi:hypothetical protein